MYERDMHPFDLVSLSILVLSHALAYVVACTPPQPSRPRPNIKLPRRRATDPLR